MMDGKEMGYLFLPKIQQDTTVGMSSSTDDVPDPLNSLQGWVVQQHLVELILLSRLSHVDQAPFPGFMPSNPVRPHKDIGHIESPYQASPAIRQTTHLSPVSQKRQHNRSLHKNACPMSVCLSAENTSSWGRPDV